MAEIRPAAFEKRLPDIFCMRMRRLMTEEEYGMFLSSYGQKRHFSLRVNPLKSDRAEILKLTVRGGDPERRPEEKRESGFGKKQESNPEINRVEYPEGHPQFRQVPWEPDGFYYPEEYAPGRLPRHEAGMYYIQEASAMVPAVLCGALPGERVLDLCAAPGGKSTKIAACLRGEGILVANEIHPERAKVLSANLERMGVRNALVTNETPQRLASRFPLYFDRVVVDAPCSGEGMFRKEEEALLHWSMENVRMCAERQTEILEEAAAMLRPGGVLVYSTCTFSPEENEGVIFRFLMEHPDFSVVSIPDMPGIDAEKWGFAPGRPEWLPEAGIDVHAFEDETRAEGAAASLRGTVRLWPHLLDGEGHFAAVLRKAGPIKDGLIRAGSEKDSPIKDGPDNNGTDKTQVCTLNGYTGAHQIRQREKDDPKRHGREEKRREKGKNRGQRAGKKRAEDPAEKEMLRMWEEFRRQNLIPADAPDAVASVGAERLFLFGSALFALPVPAPCLSLDGLRVLRAGLQLGTLIRGRFEPSHSLAMALRPEEVLRAADFEGNSPQAYAWLRGESVSLGEQADKGWTLVQIDGCGAGWAKANGGILKNHYPKGLRKGSNYKRETGNGFI